MLRESLRCGGYFFGASAGAGGFAALSAGAAGAAGGAGGGGGGSFFSAQAERPIVAASNSAKNSAEYLRISCHSFPFEDLSVTGYRMLGFLCGEI